MRAEKNAERNVRIFESVILGSTWVDAAKAEGITASRAVQIVHKIIRMMRHQKRREIYSVSYDIDIGIKEFRDNSALWMERLSKWRIEFGLSATHQPPT